MLIQIRAFMATASNGERQALATAAGTSVGHIYHLMSGYRKASAELAARIERAAVSLRMDNEKLPLIPRTDLCKACSEYEYAKRCARR